MNPFKKMRLVNKLYAAMCPKCKQAAFTYAAKNKDKVDRRDFGAIQEDMKNPDVCEKCNIKLQEIMKNDYRGDT